MYSNVTARPPRTWKALLRFGLLTAVFLLQPVLLAAQPLQLHWNRATSQQAAPAQTIQPLQTSPQNPFPQGTMDLADQSQIPCDLDRLADNLKAAFHDKCMGYQIAIYHNGQLFQHMYGGMARTSANGPARAMSSSDRLEIASISKTINSIMTIRVLDQHGVSLDASINDYLPESWDRHSSIQDITFRRLLAHETGLVSFNTVYPGGYDYSPGNVNQGLRDALEMGVVQNTSYQYNNINYDLLRVVVPYVAYPEIVKPLESDEVLHESALAGYFALLVRHNVFVPAGVGSQVFLEDWHPSGSGYDFARYYDFGQPESPGISSDNRTLRPGRGGWKMTATQLGQVLAAFEAGKLLTPAQMHEMKEYQGTSTNKLGIFKANTELGPVWRHNGKSHGGSKAGMSVYCLFPNNIQVVVLMNSANNTHGNRTEEVQNAWLDACRFPDLIVSSFYATGPAVYEGSMLKVPFFMMVRNQGKAATRSNFVNAIRHGEQFVWVQYMDELGAGWQKGVSGTVSISDANRALAGQTIKLVAWTDAPVAPVEAPVPNWGRVKESNEANNLVQFINVQVPHTSLGEQASPTIPPSTDRRPGRLQPGTVRPGLVIPDRVRPSEPGFIRPGGGTMNATDRSRELDSQNSTGRSENGRQDRRQSEVRRPEPEANRPGPEASRPTPQWNQPAARVGGPRQAIKPAELIQRSLGQRRSPNER